MSVRTAWLRLLLGRPEVPLEHLRGHGALLVAETARLLQALERRLWLTLLACLLLACAIVLAGMAAMLGLLWGVGALPASGTALTGLLGGLLAVPVLPLLAAAWVWRAAGRPAGPPPFRHARAQFDADLAAWREASRSAGAAS